MLAPINEEIARLRRIELRERACRDRQERLAVQAGSRRGWFARKRRGESSDPCYQ